MNTTEQWVLCPEVPSYEISSLGRMRRAITKTNTRAGRILRLFTFPHGYIGVSLSHEGRQKTYAVHRLACRAFHGPRPSDKHHAAHRDGIRDDNNILNLRDATHSQNGANKPARAKSGLKGVQRAGNRWQVRVGDDYIGIFKSPAEASAAYLVEAIARFGEFARAA